MVMHTHLLEYADPIVYTCLWQDTHLAECLLDGCQARALLKHHLTQSCLSKTNLHLSIQRSREILSRAPTHCLSQCQQR